MDVEGPVVDYSKEYSGREEHFMHEKLGLKMWRGSRAIVKALREHRFVSIRACRKSSKTHTSAGLILATQYCAPTICVSTAPTDRQVRDILWAKVRDISANAIESLPGKLDTMQLRLGPTRFAIGFATSGIDRFRGFHAEPEVPADPDEGAFDNPFARDEAIEKIEKLNHARRKKSNNSRLIYVFEEATGVDQLIYDACRGSWSGDNVYGIMIANPFMSPDEPHEFARSHTLKTRWHRIKIASWADPDFPDSVTADEVFDRGYGSKGDRGVPEWLQEESWAPEQKRELADVNPELYESDILGQFPQGDLGGRCFPPTVLELGARLDTFRLLRDGAHIGLDTSASGSDPNVMVLWVDGVKVSQKEWRGMNTLETAARAAQIREHWQQQIGRDIPANHIHIDDAPVAAGVIDRLAELGLRVDRVAFGGKPSNQWRHVIGKVKLLNRRAELHWVFRELLRTQRAYLPDNDLGMHTRAQARVIEYDYRTDGTLFIEPKEKVRDKLRRSPDNLDADLLAWSRSSPSPVLGVY